MATPLAIGDQRLRIFTPFGVAFVDAAFGTPVSDGLRVSACPADDPTTVVAAFRTASGIYAFAGLPGLRRIEYPQRDDDPRQTTKRRFLIQVDDLWRRFLPTLFAADVPHAGVFPTASGGLAGFYLFSAPTRAASPALATVRAQIKTAGGAGAAYAVLEATLPDGSVQRGLADRRGAATLNFPWPTFHAPSLHSLPAAPAPQQWRLRLRVRHQPTRLQRFAGISEPLLGSLFAQDYALILPSAPDSLPGAVVELEETLIHAQELVLRSGDRLPLLVESAAASSSIP